MRVLSLLTLFLLGACSRQPEQATPPAAPQRPTYVTARLVGIATVEVTATAADRPLYVHNCNELPYLGLYTPDFRLLEEFSPGYLACASKDIRIEPHTSRTFRQNIGPLSVLPKGRYRVALNNLYYSPSPGQERPRTELVTSEPIIVVP